MMSKEGGISKGQGSVDIRRGGGGRPGEDWERRGERKGSGGEERGAEKEKIRGEGGGGIGVGA